MDGFLQSQAARFVKMGDVLEGGSSRAHARLDADEAAAQPEADAPPEPDRFGNGGVQEAAEDSDDSIEEHPFFDGLKAAPKREQWDAETILTTYSTTDNHPSMIRLARKPKKGDAAIELDKRTGLPKGTMLPAEEERARLAAVVGEPGCAGDDSEGSEGSDGPAFNAGAARPKHGQESKEEKRARKAEAKEAKNARRAEKKQTKREFSQAKSSQIAVSMATKQQPSTSFSRWE